MIAFNSLYKNFDPIIINLLEMGNKIIDQIQTILQFKKVKNINKQATEAISNQIIIFRNKNVSIKKQTAIISITTAINLVIIRKTAFFSISN